MPAAHTSLPAEPAGRGRARDLFLRLLGVAYLIAFVSLAVQVRLLVGHAGLLPASEFLERVPSFPSAPTLFRLIGTNDAALVAVALVGAAVSLCLTAGLAPRWCLAAMWALYLSLVTVGQGFLSFQWDNLLLESALLAFLIAPGGLRPRDVPAPHPIATFLVLWLVFRLHVESGLAKLLLGDPGWRDLTAMASYYETAPLPTWVGWYAHQMPMWAHRASGLLVYVAELGLPFFIWGPAPLRAVAVAGMLGMQATIALTGNYGIFNYLSAALILFVLDDRQLGRIAARVGWTLAPAPLPVPGRARTGVLAVVAALVVALSAVQFLSFIPPARGLAQDLAPVRRVLNGFRSINAYHLFAQMTYVRREAVIEGSADGVTWQPYEFRYKPGDPGRRPPFVAPHQPRVDFLLWFLLLRERATAPYLERLLQRLLTAPETVASLFVRDPFPNVPPASVRVAIYRYRFSTFGSRDWWQRELERYSRVLRAAPPGGI